MFDTNASPIRALRRSGALLLLPVLLGGCTTPSAPESLPSGAIPLAAPAVYREWFARTEACSGLSGSFDRVQWLVVPEVETFHTDAGPKVGLWVRRGAQHYIVVAGNYQQHEMVVRHEMLHSLIGVSGHPGDVFSERCQLTWETWGAD